MNLGDHFCDHLELNLSFDNGEFDKDAFLRDVKSKEDRKRYRFVYSSREHKDKQHAHINVEFLDDQVEVRILYTKSNERVPVHRSHSMEDCAQWLRRFFKVSKVVAFIEGVFEFDSRYVPTVPLPFPLMASNRALSGSLVTGLALDFPEDADLDSAIVQTYDDETTVTAWGLILLPTNHFDADVAMKKFEGYVRKLMRKVAK